METIQEVKEEIERLEQEKTKVYQEIHNDYALASIMKNLEDRIIELQKKLEVLKD